MDADIPTKMEAELFCTTAGKTMWMFLQPLFYAFRPLFVRPLPPSTLEIINVVIQLSFDVFVYYYFGKRYMNILFLDISLFLIFFFSLSIIFFF